ncbi:SDR family oxidoreductase [Staphylococcus caeli]|uniref:Oxidoreductase ylbE n=1 Tax=Staphylococcus caeli TaxID=2201815 RepID=A0A1D4QNC1_9STAP|nr:SDR family oxidoreductase [Staphylococcus caeli]SCT32797.1 oxidoreductase ylbE [Staphylococcus caeli]SCT36729.1 oxidoreductase ylbE [Staphylococcus caeli]
MRTLIIGANGGIGKHLVKQLQASGDDFVAGVRKTSQVQSFENEGIDSLLIDVEADDIATLTEKFKGFDKVVFSVGSGGNTSADKTITVDLDGAIKTIKASEASGIKHYVMISTFDSDRSAFDASGDLKPYTIAKHYADEYLKKANVTYTIIHPGALLDEQGTGNVELAEKITGGGSIPRQDVATVIKIVLSKKDGTNSEFQVVSGDLPIADAVAQFHK